MRPKPEYLWLCLRFPQLPLDLLQSGQDDSQSRVVVEKQRVCFASPEARASGIDVGMSLATALALSKNLQTAERNRDSEAAALRALAQWCYRFTPCVSLRAAQPGFEESPDNDSILLEISSSLRLFRGLDNLLAQIGEGLYQQGYRVIGSLAHTPQAAWLLGLESGLNVLGDTGQLKNDCRGIDLNRELFLQRLQSMPLEHLPLAAKQLQRLRNLGLISLGELLALPRASLSRRHGKGLVRLLEHICGEREDLQLFVQPGEQFRAERHYLDGLTSVEMLQQPVDELLGELQQFLSSRQMQCQGFAWRLLGFDKQASELTIELSTAQNERRNFLDLTRLKLQKLQLSAPVETVQLYSDALLASEARSRPLFHELGLQSQTDRWQLVDLLKARLGRDALYRLALLNEHLPEYRQMRVSGASVATAVSMTTTISETAAATGRKPATEHAPPLPLWLLPQPLQLRQNPNLEIISAAWRIDSHWWRRQQRRSYFIARDTRGCHWIYYDARRKHWFLHGHYG